MPLLQVLMGARHRFIALALGRAAGFVSGVLILRSLDTTEAGRYFLVIGWALVIAGVIAGGFSSLIGRRVPGLLLKGDTDGAVRVARRSLATVAGLTVAAGAVLHLFGEPLSLDRNEIFLVTLLALLIASSELIGGLWRVRGISTMAEAPAVAISLAFLALLIIASSSLGITTQRIFQARTVAELAGAIGLIWISRRYLMTRGRRAERPPPSDRGLTGALLLSNLALLLILQSDVVLLGALKDAAAVGAYIPALRVAELVTASHAVLAPYVAIAAAKAHPGALGKVLEAVNGVSIVVAAAATAPMLIAPRTLLNALFGSVPVSSVLALQVLAAGFLVFALTGMAIFAGHSLVRNQLIVIQSVLVIVVTLVGGTLLVHSFGVVGAAASCALSYLFLAAISSAFLGREVGKIWVTPRLVAMWAAAILVILFVRLTLYESWWGLGVGAVAAPLASVGAVLMHGRWRGKEGSPI